MAALIGIDGDANKSEEVADLMLFMLKEDRLGVPRMSIFEILGSKIRPGLSADILAASITSRFGEIGIPTGPLEGGSPNVMEAFVKVLSESIVDALQNDMRIDVAVDTGITVQANGANAGGPVVAFGASISPHTGSGVAR